MSERKRRKRKNSYLFVLFLLVLPRGCRGELHREDSLSRCLGWRWWRRRWGVEERSRSRREGESTGNEKTKPIACFSKKRRKGRERKSALTSAVVRGCLLVFLAATLLLLLRILLLAWRLLPARRGLDSLGRRRSARRRWPPLHQIRFPCSLLSPALLRAQLSGPRAESRSRRRRCDFQKRKRNR